VLEKIQHIQSLPPAHSFHGTRASYKHYKEEARKVTTALVESYAEKYEFSYRRIMIRNQRTRWGSCSVQKNLSFHYKLLFLPENLQEYLVVHELCHLKEMNHSPRFWNLVAEILPDYDIRKKELHHIRIPLK